jgi:hypothetical protein
LLGGAAVSAQPPSNRQSGAAPETRRMKERRSGISDFGFPVFGGKEAQGAGKERASCAGMRQKI